MEVSVGGLSRTPAGGIFALMNDYSPEVMLSESAVPAAEHRKLPAFKNAVRVQESFLARAEKSALLWLAARMPQWVNSDHLTLLGFASLVGAGACYWLARWDRMWLLGGIIFLAINWFGDSLDGTLARYRNRQRPRYGFYVDHIVDAFGITFVLAGFGLSGYMSLPIAMGFLIAYFLVNIEIYLATYTLGVFKLSYGIMGPTEMRIVVCIGNVVLLV